MLVRKVFNQNNPMFCSNKSYLDKPMLHMTISDNVELDKFLIEQSESDKRTFEVRGLKGEITEEFIRTTHPNRYSEDGLLTVGGKEWVTKSLLAAKFKHIKEVTIGQFLAKYLKKVKLVDIFLK